MSQSRMSVAGQSQFRKHRSPRILPNQVRETPSIPVRRVRKDVLLDERHALLPSPTSKSYFRWGHRSQSRGCQHFLDFPDRRDCLEHRRPLAREGSPGVSSIQPNKDRRLRCRRASSRRDSHVRGQQEDAELGLRYDRGLVSALAIDGDGKAKLPEHSRSVSRPFEADEFRTSSPDRHGWIRILPEGHPSLLRASVSLRPGPQDAQERSYHQGRTQSAARSRVAIRRRAQ